MSTLRKVISALFFMLLGALLTAGAFGLHVVRGPAGHFTIWKTRPSLKDVYVDVRGWKREKWKKHPDLVQALIESGHEDVLPEPKPKPVNPLQRFFENLTGNGDRPDTPPPRKTP